MIQAELVERYQLSGFTGLAVGALSGSAFSATLSHPMDTIKTCMQGVSMVCVCVSYLSGA